MRAEDAVRRLHLRLEERRPSRARTLTYSEKHVYYKGVNDTRSCSPCGCDHDCDYAWRVEAAGASCSAPFTLDENDSCVMVSPTDGKLNVGVQISGNGDRAARPAANRRARDADWTGDGLLPAVALEAQPKSTTSTLTC